MIFHDSSLLIYILEADQTSGVNELGRNLESGISDFSIYLSFWIEF